MQPCIRCMCNVNACRMRMHADWNWGRGGGSGHGRGSLREPGFFMLGIIVSIIWFGVFVGSGAVGNEHRTSRGGRGGGGGGSMRGVS